MEKHNHLEPLARAFCSALYDFIDHKVKRAVRENETPNKYGRLPHTCIPRFPQEIAETEIFLNEQNRPRDGNDFRALRALCSDSQQFVDLLAFAMTYLQEVLLIERRHIKPTLKDIDLSAAIVDVDFRLFTLIGVDFSDSDLRKARLDGVQAFRKSDSAPGVCIGDGNVSLYGADIADATIKSYSGLAVGYSQYTAVGGFGMAAQKDIVGLTYPSKSRADKPFRLFVGERELTPNDIITEAITLFLPGQYEASQTPENFSGSLAGIALASYFVGILSQAILKAGQESPSSARAFQHACELELTTRVRSRRDQHTIWSRLCSGR